MDNERIEAKCRFFVISCCVIFLIMLALRDLGLM